MLIAVGSADKCIYTLIFEDGEYVKNDMLKLENGVPCSINFSQDSKKIVICTSQRKLLLLDPATRQLFYKPDDLTNHMWLDWVSRYPCPTKQSIPTFMPICLCNNS